MVAWLFAVVDHCFVVGHLFGGPLGQAGAETAKSMDPEMRFRLIGQLILLVIGGVALVTLAWLALRIGRRYVQRADPVHRWSRGGTAREDWAQRPIVPPADSEDDAASHRP